MKEFTLAICFALLATATAAHAASHEHESHHGTATQQSTATHAGTGILKAVNAKTGKIQIAHDPIATLDWPSMTMWFVLKTALPQNLRVGDSVSFVMKENEKKQWEVVRIGRK